MPQLVALAVAAEMEDLHGAHDGSSAAAELALGGAYLAAFDPEASHPEHLGGFGGSFSLYFFRHVLSFELVAHVLFGAEVISFPIDFVLKADATFGRVVHPYVTLGPTLVPELEHEGPKLWLGAALALGSDFWLSEHWGFMLELNGNLIARRGIRPEIGAFVGPVFRF